MPAQLPKRGEIRKLTKLVKPEVAVITAIEKSHLEGLKSLKNIADAKSEILESIIFTPAPSEMKGISLSRCMVTT